MGKTNASRDFKFPYVVTDRKLMRVVDVCSQHLRAASQNSDEDEDEDEDEDGDEDPTLEFRATMKGEKTVTYRSLEELLGADNTRGGGIVELKMNMRAGMAWISVEFLERFGEPRISVQVSDDSGNWVRSSIAEVEEQVERMRQSEWPVRLKRAVSESIWAGPFLAAGVGGLSFWLLSKMLLRVAPEYQAEKNEIFADAENAVTVEDKVDILLRLEMLKDKPQLALDAGGLLSMPALILGFVAVLVCSCVVYLWKYCYPLRVFAWGDAGEYYEDVKKRRTFIWGGVILAMTTGILSSLAATALSNP